VATLGTACTAEHVQKLFRFTDSVVFSFDGDSAGRRAARKALEAALPFATDVRSVKFLFLPAEHDPDSFIRANGTDAFAAMVKAAVPLSRFMLDAASQDCDMDTAEGRAHMASNARGLWSLLPDGALKSQLLAEIADQVQIDSRELLQLWQPASANRNRVRSSPGRRAPRAEPAPPTFGYGGDMAEDAFRSGPPRYPGYDDANDGRFDGLVPDGPGSQVPPAYGSHGDADGAVPFYGDGEPAKRVYGQGGPAGQAGTYGKSNKYGSGSRDSWAASRAPSRRVIGRITPASREDRVLRALLTEPQAWDRLSPEEHAMLSGLPAPHGPLFVWLESQLHEHGPQPWAAAREGLRGHAHERFALGQLAQIPEGIESDWAEVRAILDALLDLGRKQELTALASRADTDPAALARYRELSALLKKP
jgi:DNA primase